jgi:hypothetical protein
VPVRIPPRMLSLLVRYGRRLPQTADDVNDVILRLGDMAHEKLAQRAARQTGIRLRSIRSRNSQLGLGDLPEDLPKAVWRDTWSKRRQARGEDIGDAIMHERDDLLQQYAPERHRDELLRSVQTIQRLASPEQKSYLRRRHREMLRGLFDY